MGKMRLPENCSKCHQPVTLCAKMVRWAETVSTVSPVFCSRLPAVGYEFCRQHLIMLGMVRRARSTK